MECGARRRTHATEIDADQRAAAEGGIKETPAFLVRAGKSAEGYFIDATDYASKLGRVVERALDESGADRPGRSE
jgi:hypothetical protein